MWANFMRDKLWVMTEQQSQNLLLKVRPALYYSEQQVYHSRWKIGNRDSEGESFCIEYIVATFKAAIKKEMGFRIFSNARRPAGT